MTLNARVHTKLGTLTLDCDVSVESNITVAVLGPNGAGKTTLLRVLLEELPPDAGTVVIGKNTKVAYYDQQRAQLDPEQTVYEAASEALQVPLTAWLIVTSLARPASWTIS